MAFVWQKNSAGNYVVGLKGGPFNYYVLEKRRDGYYNLLHRENGDDEATKINEKRLRLYQVKKLAEDHYKKQPKEGDKLHYQEPPKNLADGMDVRSDADDIVIPPLGTVTIKAAIIGTEDGPQSLIEFGDENKTGKDHPSSAPPGFDNPRDRTEPKGFVGSFSVD